MANRRDLPRYDDLPIPPDARPGRGWNGFMVEMADHIGPYPTLQLIAAFGGENVRIARDATRSPFAAIVGNRAAEIIAHVYGGEKIDLPLGRDAIWYARAAPVIDQVRRGALSVADAARILKTTRKRLSSLVNHQVDVGTVPPRAARRGRHDPRQIDLFSSPD